MKFDWLLGYYIVLIGINGLCAAWLAQHHSLLFSFPLFMICFCLYRIAKI